MKIFFGNLLLVFLLVIIASEFSFAQSPRSARINSYLRMVAEGNVATVRKEFPALITEFGEYPGVMLLQGVVLENASQAVPHYQRILENHPNSEWAPHAAWRLIQYYSIVTDTATAKRHLDRFRERYPTSPFLAPATDAVRLSISDARHRHRENIPVLTIFNKSLQTVILRVYTPFLNYRGLFL